MVGSSEGYYAFFSSFLILALAVITSYEERDLYPLKNALIGVFFISLSLFINLIPHYLGVAKHGVNTEVAVRNPTDAELFGLKIYRMLLPGSDYRFSSTIKELNHYASYFAEGIEHVYFGIFTTLGFLYLVWILIAMPIKNNSSHTLLRMSRLNILAVLLGVTGGFGSIFAFLVSPMIRGYTRLGIIIAFFSLFAFFYAIQEMTNRMQIFKHSLASWMFVAFLTLIGVCEYSSAKYLISTEQKIKESENNSHFIEGIEAILPQGSMVFQLPYISFPGYDPVYRMKEFDHFMLYLHSKSLRWSYGAMRGSETDDLQKYITTKPAKELIHDLIYYDFDGVTINRKGYRDRAENLEKEFSTILEAKPLQSADGELLFFDLRKYKSRLKDSLEPNVWEKRISMEKSRIRDESLMGNKVAADWNKGFYGLECQNNECWRWAEKEADLIIHNKTGKPIRVALNFALRTFYPEHATVSFRCEVINQDMRVNNQGGKFSEIVQFPAGKTVIHIETDARQVVVPNDKRPMYFRLVDFEMKPEGKNKT